MPQSKQRSALQAEDYAYSLLSAYSAYQWPQYQDAPHHRLICRKLEAVERGEIPRLIIEVPPRHGKSMLASENFPAWYLGRNPDHYVIAATYAQDLADDFGRKVRNQIQDASFGLVFPGVALRADSQSSKRFAVTSGQDTFTTNRDGAYYAVGVGGPLTGRGAHLLLIDDPVKNREEAESEIIRKKTKEWYTSTAYTRLMPGGRIVIIQTRWHEDDLAGWLEREHSHEGWDIVKLPAINPNGEPLWPEQYDIPALEGIKRAIGPRDWSALYQQQPSPETGDYFRAEWIRSCESLPELRNLKVYGGSDYAVTADGGDYTVHVVIGLDPDNRMYLLDMWRGQQASDKWVEAFCDLVLKWQPIGWAEETGQIKSGVGPFIVKRMIERRALVYREAFPTRGDKAIRAQSIRGRMAMDGLYIQKDAPFRTDLITELMSFPVGVHDDQADALGLVGQLMDRMQAGDKDKTIAKTEPKPTGYLPPLPMPDDRMGAGERRIKI